MQCTPSIAECLYILDSGWGGKGLVFDFLLISVVLFDSLFNVPSLPRYLANHQSVDRSRETRRIHQDSSQAQGPGEILVTSSLILVLST